jgi:uncharacterized protein involved in exopolysaccharide biosynthesis
VGAAVGAAGGVLIALLLPPRYIAIASFTPEASSPSSMLGGLGGLAGVAGQLGLLSQAGASGPSSDFFTALTTSRSIAEELLAADFPTGDSPQRTTLYDALHVPGDLRGTDRIAEAARRLGKRVSASSDRRTGIVSISVELGDPILAAAVANKLIALLNRFNLERRQFQSRAQRVFIEGRLEGARRELREAEGQTLHFLTTNRSYGNSPALANEYERLRREMTTKQDVYASLAKSFEDARIAEVRDTPVLTVIDSALAPDRRSFPSRRVFSLLGLAVGLIVGPLAAVWFRRPVRLSSPAT